MWKPLKPATPTPLQYSRPDRLPSQRCSCSDCQAPLLGRPRSLLTSPSRLRRPMQSMARWSNVTLLAPSTARAIACWTVEIILGGISWCQVPRAQLTRWTPQSCFSFFLFFIFSLVDLDKAFSSFDAAGPWKRASPWFLLWAIYFFSAGLCGSHSMHPTTL